MREFEKPKLTTNERNRLNKLYVLLKERVWTKDELAAELGISERKVRDLVSILAKKRPVIALSSNRGYRIAISEKDIEDARHCWKEIDSRIAELEERKKLLIEFEERIAK